MLLKAATMSFSNGHVKNMKLKSYFTNYSMDKLLVRLFLFIFVTNCVNVAKCSKIDNEVEDMMDMGVDIPNNVEVNLGIPDVQTTVGKLLSFTIPENAFSSGPKTYQYEVFLTNDSEKKLPKWLNFDKNTFSLQGIPQMKHLGKTKLTVTASLPSNPNSNSKGQTTFDIDVKKPTHENTIPVDGMDTGTLSKIVKCDEDEPFTYMSIQLDTDMDEQPPHETINLISKISSEMGLPKDFLRMFPLNEDQSLFGHSSLVDGGPGNSRSKRHSNNAIVQWKVGCSGSIHDHHKGSVNQIETTAQDGTLAKILGSPVIGWLLTKDSIIFEDNNVREKRSVINEEVINLNEFEEIEPESRIVPTLASPRYKTKGRHARSNNIVHHKIPEMNDMYFGGTPLPTPAVVPTRPTQGIVTTVIDERSKSIAPTMTQPAVMPTDIKPTPSMKIQVTDQISSSKTTKQPEKTKLLKNFKPTVINRIDKMSVVAGKFSTFKIPTNTFADFEDGSTVKLKLYLLLEDRTVLPKDSWIQFDPDEQIIYSLPLEEHIGSYSFILEACDSEHLCAFDKIDIVVRQHKKSRVFNHKFTASLKFESWKYPLNVDWRILFVEKIASFYGDLNADSIIVRNVDINGLQISWLNDTLISHPCPSKTIELLYKHLSSKKKPNHPSKKFREFMKKDLEVTKVGLKLSSGCEGHKYVLPTVLPDGKVITTPLPDNIDETSGTKVNNQPTSRNQIDHINATVGQVLVYKIPHDTFYDVEDSKNGKLKLSFMSIDGVILPNSSWIKFNPFTQELYGLPFEEDEGELAYKIIALDTGNLSAQDAFVIKVNSRPKLKPLIQFSVVLDEDYQKFRNDVSRQVLLSKKISTLMGDSDTSNITVISITKGSVVFAWTNISLSQQDDFRNEDISYLNGKMFNDDGSISQQLINALKPEFKILRAQNLPLGTLLGKSTPTSDVVTPAIRPKKTEHATSNEDIYITTIIPAVIIAAMLLIAAIIACLLYRKKRKGKMTTQDNSTFISKGIPIIFADEIDDNKACQPTGTKGKSPALLKDEKPPLPPPEYTKAVGNNSESDCADSPLLEHRDREPPVPPHSWGSRGSRGRNSLDEPYDSPSYQPPPPYPPNSNTRQARPKMTPTYRNPPPYIPP
ncbi:Dystroglycan [Nymphon striatum]|nr:Dystroglycan [Nymphon striatum]